MSYQVIARKWRPRNFGDLVGQSHVTQTLENAIRKGRVAHAYIFSGIRGTGKTSTARILAKALNCATTQGKTPIPCDNCDSCREIAAGNSLDVLEIDAASNRGIDQIRELREMVRYAAAGGRYKVVILDEAHQLTDEASNALLKTLEEPPDNVVFILATTQAEDLVETLKSRAQFFQFRALSFSEIAGAIENIAKEEKLEIEPGAVAVLARAAEGSLRDALSLLEQAMAYGGANITSVQVRELLGVVGEETLSELVAAIAEQSAERALALVNRLIADGQNLQHFCRETIRHFRNLLVARVCGADSELITAPAEERPRLAEQAQRFSEEDLTRFFQILLETDYDLRRKPDPRLHMELGLLKMLNAKRLAPLEEVLAELRGFPARGTTPGSKAATASGVAAKVAPGPAASGAPRGDASPAPRAESNFSAGVLERAVMDTASISVAQPSVGAFAPAPPATLPSTVSPSAAIPPRGINGAKSNPPPETNEEADSSAAPMTGVTAEQRQALQAALEPHKFLNSMVEQATRWELEGAEMRIFFTPEYRAVAEMLQAREPVEKLRNILGNVMGGAIRICVKLETARSGDIRSQDLRRKFEEDPAVRGVLERFGGRISSVRRRGES
jgi:DNA polymerase-3 subunit gamma/tau